MWEITRLMRTVGRLWPTGLVITLLSSTVPRLTYAHGVNLSAHETLAIISDNGRMLLINEAGHVVAIRTSVKVPPEPHENWTIPDAYIPYPMSVSVSATHVYFVLGSQVWAMSRSGTTKMVATVPGRAYTQVAIAVSPDDRTMAVGLLTFTLSRQQQMGGGVVTAPGVPVHEHLYTINLGSGQQHKVFVADVSQDSGTLIRPIGWRGSAIVLSVGPIGSQQGPPNPYGAWYGYHVVNSADGTRLATICPHNDGGPGPNTVAAGIVGPSGAACIYSSTVIYLQSWDGRCTAFSSSSNIDAYSVAPAPDGFLIAAYDRVLDSAVLLRKGSDPMSLNMDRQPVGWLDSNHLVVGDHSIPNQMLWIYNLKAHTITPLALAQGRHALSFLGALPGGLGGPAPTGPIAAKGCPAA